MEADSDGAGRGRGRTVTEAVRQDLPHGGPSPHRLLAHEEHPEYPDPHDLVDETWNADERHQAWFYLATGTMLRPQMGKSTCRICGAQNGTVEYTDETFIWPEGLGHYIYDHGVRLPDDVIHHAITRLADLEARRVSVDWWLAHSPR